MKTSSVLVATATTALALMAVGGSAAATLDSNMARSQALNKQYNLEGDSWLPAAMAAHSHLQLGDGASRALALRGAALNKQYGNAWTRMSVPKYIAFVRVFGPGITQRDPAQIRDAALGSGGGFKWGDAGVGSAGALALLLVLAGAAGFVSRSNRAIRTV